MHLSILLPRRLSAEEKSDMAHFLKETGFERGKDDSYRATAPFTLTLHFEENPREDPFWISCALDDLFFLPLEEILMTSKGDGPSNEKMYRIIAELSGRLRGLIYDHQLDRVYGPGGVVLEDHGGGGRVREYGAVIREGPKKEER